MFPGHLRAKQSIADSAFFMLIRQYSAYEPFVADCRIAKARYEAAESSDDIVERITRTREIVAELGRRWNLDRVPNIREHNLEPLKRAIGRMGEKIGNTELGVFWPMPPGIVRWEPEEPDVSFGERTWTWCLNRHESLATLRNRMVDDLGITGPKDLPAELVAQLRELPEKARGMGYAIGDTRHSLPQHVRWLFLRLCPQPDYPLGFKRIAALEPMALVESTVRRTVSSLAKQMRIELPPLSAGRPRSRRHGN